MTAAPVLAPGEDISGQSVPANNGYQANADPKIDDIANDHSPQHPADNSPHAHGRDDDDGSPAETDGAHPGRGRVDGIESASPKFADDGGTDSGKVSHDPPGLTALANEVSGDDSAHGAHTAHGQADRSGDSASPKFADDGSTNSGKVPHDPPGLTALANDVSGDDPAQPGKTNQGHHASADPDINDVANNHPLQPPADNSLQAPAQLDDNGSSAVTNGDSFKFADNDSAHPGTIPNDPTAVTAPSSDSSGTHGPSAPALVKTLDVPDAAMSPTHDQFVFADN